MLLFLCLSASDQHKTMIWEIINYLISNPMKSVCLFEYKKHCSHMKHKWNGTMLENWMIPRYWSYNSKETELYFYNNEQQWNQELNNKEL